MATQLKEFQKRIMGYNENTFNKMRELKKEREEECGVYEREIEINKAITKKTKEHNEQLMAEIKVLKQMIQVPRLHFKNIEKSDWDSLKREFDIVQEKKRKMEETVPND
mmetsp:Transcript_31399/g.48016  ORF Transcript_31399/g.48016 Transcript_31399/m.48016 type:complete len:109 (-) Transcript_31399:187-513(-)|eukprot:CAMPEP_0170512424 /NCGR_PEP_ID=MMETSP0208-20121228/66840_1 /TAXON_ID=197538 /ORGANISM="Strombidium inclinatum, Strain S3" /LENGTH=108 /DNA_ID=CAMNT_0010796049 /DNA_START=129 /DNA_END=455 /DNA_ORIENTATION=-